MRAGLGHFIYTYIDILLVSNYLLRGPLEKLLKGAESGRKDHTGMWNYTGHKPGLIPQAMHRWGSITCTIYS